MPRGWLVGAVLLVAACAALAGASGAIDLGEGTGSGPTAMFLALALGAPVAALAVWWAAPRGAFRPWTVRVGLGAAAGLAAWSAMSILWAAAPDLAWLEANRMALALCALTLGVGVARTTPRPGAAVAVGMTAVALPVAVWGLATKVAPTLVGPDRGFARLSEPMDYWNALALLMALALPGAMWLTGRPGARPVERMLAAAGITVLVVTLVLTYSRGGIVVALLAVALCVWLMPHRLALLGTAAAGVAGAVLPLAYGLTTGALTVDGIAAAERRGAGIALGWRILVGLVVAGALVFVVLRVAPRLHPHSRVLRRAGAAALLVALVALAVTGGMKYDSIANRIDRLGDDSSVGNTAGRLTDPSLNRRLDWAAEAVRGFADAPLAGHGAGGFRLIHLAERQPPANTRESIRHPHQLATQVAGEVGIVGVILLAALVGAIVGAAIRARRRGADPTIGLAIAIAAGFMLHVQVDWTWSIPGVAVPAFVACGALLSAGGASAGPRRALPAWGVPALAVAATLAAASAFLPWQAAREVEAAYAGDAYSHTATARSLNPLAIDADILEAGIAATNDPGRALRAARRATTTQPKNPRAWRTLILAGATGEEAAAARARYRELDPLGTQP